MYDTLSKGIHGPFHQLRVDAETRAPKKLTTATVDTEKDELLYELEVHQLELEMQNNELQLAHYALEESRNVYLNLFEFAPIGYLTINAKGLITEANLPAASLLDVSRKKLLLSPFVNYMSSARVNHTYLTMFRLNKPNERQNYDIEIKRTNGTLLNVEVHAVQMESKDGNLTWHVALLDFTEKKKAQDALLAEKENREAELVIANKELVFQNSEKENRAAELVIANKELSIAAIAFESQEGMAVTNANNVILRVNHAFTKITGYSAEEAIGQTPRLLSSGRQDEAFYISMWQCINSTGAWEGEIWNRHKSGKVYPEHLTITAVTDTNDIVTNYVATLTDITMHKAASDEINNLAFYDTLTQLPNRRLLLDRLNQGLAVSVRSGQRGALLFLDLDHFKILNDTLGHGVGDLLLQQVATRLTACVREGDTVARLGGDEFVVLLVGLSEQGIEAAAQTKNVAEKILTSLTQSYQLNTHTYRSTPSIGATLFKGQEQATDELLKQADIAMYQSKSEGRNTLRFFDPMMQEVITARADIENELRTAINQHQFQLYYQIQVGNTGQAFGAEALIRWKHPERGMILPSNFIPLAEETGLILPIGQWVLEAACAQIKTWQQNPLTQDLVLAVNVSAKQFHQVDFVEQVKAALLQHETNPARLKLELTESMLVNNINDIITKINMLSEIGILFSLDDFGTGYSSLQYLKKLPLNQLKIDQSFVRDIVTDASDRVIVSTIITMAHSLGINVIAEGVETAEQRQYLLNEGCTNYQGYLFSKPVSIDEFEALLRI
ncbi:MAG: EAL domain-containing protein [Methylotenera sp.]|nr:EAL domain-containing protein [Methylotenera sp.]MDP2280472.1 EAL domain-containing protein [Methylotenera sp.]MDP3060032.1 EAL domain-containing protein [Methylotenera sp.]